MHRFLSVAMGVLLAVSLRATAADSSGASTPVSGGLRMATFDVDATPPIGSMMAYDAVTNRWDLGLRARGIVLLGAGEPIVLCAVDWIGIANGGHDAFQVALARAAGTSPGAAGVTGRHDSGAPNA